MRSLRSALVAMLVCGAVLASACGSDDDDGSTSPTETTTAEPAGDTSAAPTTAEPATVQQGGEARIIAGIDAGSLDPTIGINSAYQGSTILNALYDVLFTVDGEGNVQGRIATEFSSDDGINWTMVLRDGVTFSDGTPYDAEAVMAQWDRVKENIRAGAAWAGIQYHVESWSVVDPLTFEIVLKAPNRQFHQFVAWSNLVWIPSPTAYAAAGDAFGDDPVGAGPFLLASRSIGVETVLERNPTFWQEGYPKLDRLTVTMISDLQQAEDTFDTGGADATINYTRADAEENGYRITEIDLIGGTCWLFGTQSGPFSDVRARQAVYLAIDMDQLNANLYDGKNVVATSVFPEGTEFHNPDITFPEPDPVEAQRLFDELAAEGNPVEFTIIGTPGNQPAMVEIQTQLGTFDNVEVSVEVLDGPTYGVTLFGGQFELAVYGILGRDPSPPLEGLRSDWPLPIASLGNPQVDAALDEAITATDHDARQAAYDEFHQVLNEEYRLKWMFSSIFFAAMTDEVDGLELYGQGSALVHGFGRVG